MNVLPALIIMTSFLLLILIVLTFVAIASPKRKVSPSRTREDIRKIKEKISESED